jgi:hypothetical protein
MSQDGYFPVPHLRRGETKAEHMEKSTRRAHGLFSNLAGAQVSNVSKCWFPSTTGLGIYIWNSFLGIEINCLASG